MEKIINYIDLGLSVKWADRNVGAGTIKDNGKYFTFGEAKKQGNVPTKEQFHELIHECKWNWKGKGKVYEVIGPNGNSIYFPAAGYYDDSCVCDIYTRGFYWSSSLNNNDYCYHLYFNRDVIDIYNDNSDYYTYSLSVRLVK